jgi:hypothetical protein
MALGANLKNPQKLIEIIIMIVLASGVLVVGLPILVTNIIGLTNITNLGFVDFFDAGGIVLLALGASVVLGFLTLIGIGRSKR